ncbi:MAG: hypothetical protein K6253_03145, partial [Candidatus Liberibacter asiaticus]|nr:hypothetical protein [Candidatus Liberibacter asiaticus]
PLTNTENNHLSINLSIYLPKSTSLLTNIYKPLTNTENNHLSINLSIYLSIYLYIYIYIQTSPNSIKPKPHFIYKIT